MLIWSDKGRLELNTKNVNPSMKDKNPVSNCQQYNFTPGNVAYWIPPIS